MASDGAPVRRTPRPRGAWVAIDGPVHGWSCGRILGICPTHRTPKMTTQGFDCVLLDGREGFDIDPVAEQGRCQRLERERRRWDSNPRWPCDHNGFRDRPIRPLSHSSNWTFVFPHPCVLVFCPSSVGGVVGTRNANRTGTMRERPPGSGRWQLRVFAGIDPTTGRPRQASRPSWGLRRSQRVMRSFASEAEAGKVDRKPSHQGADRYSSRRPLRSGGGPC